MAQMAIYVAQQIAVAVIAAYAVSALTPNQKVQGPRIGENRMQTSNEGSPRPDVYGCYRLSVNVIDGLDHFEEVATTEEQGGKGGGGVDVTTYSYFATVAGRVCNGNISGVRRIWADTKLIWDISTNGTTRPTNIYEGDVVVGATANGITVYFGNQTLPDPSLEIIHGPNDTPAYTGRAYIVFNRLDVTEWGRFPNITAEVMSDATFGDKRTDHLHPEFGYRAGAYDEQRNCFYVVNENAIYTVDPSGSMQRSTLSDTTLTAQAVGYGKTATLAPVICSKAGSPNTHLAMVNPAGGGVARVFDLGAQVGPASRSVNFDGFPETLGAPLWADRFQGLGSATYVGKLPGGSEINTLVLVRVNTQSGETTITSPNSGHAYSLCYEPVHDRYVIGADTSNYYLVMNTPGSYIVHDRNLAYVGRYATPAGKEILEVIPLEDGSVLGVHRDGYVSRLASNLTVSTVLNDHAGFNFHTAAYDKAGQRLFVVAQGVVGNRNPTNARSVRVYSTATWELLQSLPLLNDGINGEPGDLVYIAETNTLRTPRWTYSLQRLNPDDVLVSDIARKLLERAQVPADKIVVDLLSDPSTVGYQKSGVMSTRDALMPLCNAYAIDVIDTGYAIKVLSRGRAPVATVHEDELLALESGDAVVEVTLPQESELPSKVSVGYLDRALDYQVGSQPSQRRLTTSETAITVELPIVFDGNTQTRTIADRILAEYLASSKRYNFNLPLDYLHLEPGDALTLVFNDGTSKLLVLYKCELSLDALGLFCEAATFAPELYGALPPQTATVPPPTLKPDSSIVVEPLELPALDDGDSGSPVAYVAAHALVPGGWRPSGLFISRDGGSTYALQGSLANSAVGSCATALPTGRQACYTDNTSTLRVRMEGGVTLASTTREQLLNGANAAAVITAAGDVEVIQFQTATLQFDGSYVLSGLLNGRLGTEHAMDSHTAGERFVLLKTSRLARQVFATSEIGSDRFLKGVPSGTTLPDALPTGYAPTGRNLKPYSPVRVRGTRDVDGNLSLTWVRRSRLRGAWRTGNWAPLGEATESYVVEVLDGEGNVVRTLDGLSSPAATYAAVQQVEDFGEAQGSVAIRVYQLSAVVGRGYPATASV